MEFYCEVCSGYCLDVSLTSLSTITVHNLLLYFTTVMYLQCTTVVVLYTIHSTNHTIQYYYGVFLYFLFFEKIEIKKPKVAKGKLKWA